VPGAFRCVLWLKIQISGIIRSFSRFSLKALKPMGIGGLWALTKLIKKDTGAFTVVVFFNLGPESFQKDHIFAALF
jgi:hypothetical protein